MTITAAFTTPAAEGLTRANVLRRCLRETGFGHYGTATGGAGGGAYLIDTTTLQSSQFSDENDVGAWLRIEYDAGGSSAAPEAEIRPINEYSPGEGKYTLSPRFSAAVASGDRYQVWRYIHPQVVLDTLDQVMKEDVWVPSWTLLTECPDGDMEQSHSTDWTGTNATVTKVTTGAAMVGRRWLSVVSTSAGGYAASATISVAPSRQYHVSALVRANAASTTAKLVAYDATNGAEIKSVTSTRLHNTRLWLEFTTPATCNQLVIRLVNVEDAVTTFWDEVCVYGMDQNTLLLPWWVKNAAQVKGIFRLTPGTLGDGLWTPELFGALEPNLWDFQEDQGKLRLVKRRSGGISGPRYILGTRNETAWDSENGETKRVDANFLAAALNFRLFNQLAYSPIAGTQNTEWLDKALAKWEAAFDAEKRKQAIRLSELIQSEAPDAYYYASSATTVTSQYTVR